MLSSGAVLLLRGFPEWLRSAPRIRHPALLAAIRHYFFRKQRHRLFNQSVIHDPALIKITDELIHPIVALQHLYSLDAISRVAKDAHLVVEVFVIHPFDPSEDLAKSFKALDVGIAERAQPLRRLSQKPQKARLALFAS